MNYIDQYIELAKNMENTSDGGSAAYHFDEVVLIKYTLPTKYGKARENEEIIAEKANEKNANGVRTPKHLGIKRIIDGENEICWVLQEKAKSKNFKYYCRNEDCQEQIIRQSIIANAPQNHFDKFVIDLCELYNLGMEIKPKNLFYDEDIIDGGFTIIDLLGIYKEPFNNSLKDVLNINSLSKIIGYFSMIDPYNKNSTENDNIISTQLYYEIRKKLFIALENTIPNFNLHKRWVLRSTPSDVLKYFSENGIEVGNLELNEQEYIQFNQMIKDIVDNSIRKIEEGKNYHWEIVVNEIGSELGEWGLYDSWFFNKNNVRDKSEFIDSESPEYDYIKECKRDLENYVIMLYENRLIDLSTSSDNSYIARAFSDLIKMKKENPKIK